MTTFTKEQLISHVSENVKAMKFAVKQTAFKNSLEAIELDLALALVAQASLEAEPVLYMNRFTGKTFSLEEQPGADKEPEIYVPLYAAPPDSAAMLQAGNFREKKGSSTNNFREISETSTNYPVIPSEVLSAILKVAKIRADFDDFDGDRRGIGDCLDEAEQELIVTINKYASQLAAEPIATNDVREQTAVPPVPVTPDGWISCSDRMPEMGERQYYVLAADFKNNYPPSIPNTQVGVYGDWFNDGNPTWDDGDGEDLHLKEVTHWMPLPEPPKEVRQ